MAWRWKESLPLTSRARGNSRGSAGLFDRVSRRGDPHRWMHFTATNARERVVFQSGRLLEDGSIAGTDNDAEARAYEPLVRMSA